MNADLARRNARRTLGNFTVIREECRDKRGVTWIHDFRQDLLYGFRMMRQHAVLTAIAAIALAFGIGANTAVLSAAHTLQHLDLPFPEADRLVTLGTHHVSNTPGNGNASIPDYLAWKEGTREFESIGVSMTVRQDFAAERPGDYAARLVGQAVSPSLFPTLSVSPALGRVFRDDEVQIGAAPASVIVISHRLWQQRFGGDAHILGRQIRLNGQSFTIIGVMPSSFWYPNKAALYWVPFGITRQQLEGSAKLFQVAARLKRGTTLEKAQNDIGLLAAQLAHDFPERHRHSEARAVPVKKQWFGWLDQPLFMLEAAAALGLLIACANVSILLLRRVPARRPEISLRVKMGAGRERIVRQFLTESLLLAVVGGGLGLLVAWWTGISLVRITAPPGGIPLPGVGTTGSILGFTAVLSVLSGLLFGFLPTRAAVIAANELRKSDVVESRRRPAGLLVSVQVGLALVLLIPAGLLINSFVRLVLDDRGFDPRGVLTFNYRIPAGEYATPSSSYHGLMAMKVHPPTLAMQRVYDKLRALPDAESVAASSAPPVDGIVLPTTVLLVEGRTAPTSVSERGAVTVTHFLVTENFFATMKTPIVRGRDFDARDTASTPWVAVINETLAQRFWPGESPIGRKFTVDAVSGERERQVIGVIRDVPLQYVRNKMPQAVAYTLYRQQPEEFEGLNAASFGQMTLFIRSNRDPMSLAPAVRQAVAEVDPNRPPADFQTMTAFVERGMRRRGFYASMLGLFAFMAVVLAAASMYGAITLSASDGSGAIRTNILGTRAREAVAGSVGRILRSVVMGLPLGVVGALLLTQVIEPQLWGVSATDPATFTLVTALLVAVYVAACFISLRRAARPDTRVPANGAIRHS